MILFRQQQGHASVRHIEAIEAAALREAAGSDKQALPIREPVVNRGPGAVKGDLAHSATNSRNEEYLIAALAVGAESDPVAIRRPARLAIVRVVGGQTRRSPALDRRDP